ncbi:MAG: Hsp20/alpha crystallin family protein [Anaeroplasmataceae bacterium]
MYFLDENFGNALKEVTQSINAYSLRTDIVRDENSYSIYVNVPGVKKEDISLNVEDNKVYLEVKRANMEESEGKCIISQRSFTEAKRVYELEDINPDSVKAKLENGVLCINISKIVKEPEIKKTILIE